MSEENHPNLHAVGFLCDIIDSLEQRVRGPAKEQMKLKAVESALDKENLRPLIFPQFKEEILEFVEKIDDKLNKYFGGPHLE